MPSERNEFKALQIECQKRRQSVFDSMLKNSIAIIPSATQLYRNYDAEFPFRQESNFYYLSGLTEPNAVLILMKAENSASDQNKEQQYLVFCKNKTPEEAKWTGKSVGTVAAIKEYGADSAYDISEWDSKIIEFISGKTNIYYSFGFDAAFDHKILSIIQKMHSMGRKYHLAENIIDCRKLIENLRVIKSPYEITEMKKACAISVQAHLALLENCAPGKMEYELEGEFIASCFKAGSRFMAYTPIVASGKNACILHYVQNDQELKNGELLLVDAGCEYHNYASDITRVYPVTGKFSTEQKQIYDLVLESQLAAINSIKPGVSWDSLQDSIVDILVAGLIKLNILKGEKEKLIQDKAYRPYYMHSSGHYLGLDVHDCGEYKKNNQSRLLEPGMVLTVEPGLYFSPSADLDKKWWNIGIRIEDDVLVTERGCEILTEGLPKTVKDIEDYMEKSKKK